MKTPEGDAAIPQPNVWEDKVPILGVPSRTINVAVPCVGIDGCGEALKKLGDKYVGVHVMDIEKRYQEHLSKHLPKGSFIQVGAEGDVSKLDLDRLMRPIELLCSRPPCPPWVGNGCRGGPAGDPRAKVFVSVMKQTLALMRSNELNAVVLENVRGILHVPNGQGKSFLEQPCDFLKENVSEFNWSVCI